MNTPISFEVVKLLKEKEFDKSCVGKYLDGVYYKSAFGETPIEKYQDRLIDAPTIAEVVMWLYEKHGIWIYSYFLGGGYSCYIIQKFQKTDPKLPIVGLVKDSVVYDELYNSPTEAYIAAIENMLNNFV